MVRLGITCDQSRDRDRKQRSGTAADAAPPKAQQEDRCMRVTTLYAIVMLAATMPSPGWTQPVAAISDDVVRIGLLLDMSGPYADITGKGSETAARMAAEDFKGKVLGKPIEVIATDHLNKPDVAAEKAREWFDTGKAAPLLHVSASPPPLPFP